MPTALEVRSLRKVFQRRVRAPGLLGLLRSFASSSIQSFEAVRGLDFDVEEGESLAIIGPNGAGKSTTIKMLTGILFPTAGEARVLGLVPWRERRRLAMNTATVFGQRSQLWYDLPAGETFDLLSCIYELPKADYRLRRDALVERFELGPLLGTAVRKLSLGQRMRCELAASLLHRPRILFLDEPTIGLDVVAKQELRAVIREMNRDDGVTVLLTSHDAGDIQHLSRRVMVINRGEAVFDDRVSSLRNRYLRHKVVGLRFENPVTELPSLDGVSFAARSPFHWKLEVDTDRQPIDRVLSTLVASLRIADITVEDPPLEEIIADIYREQAPVAQRIPS